jgi:predicted acyltransferase
VKSTEDKQNLPSSNQPIRLDPIDQFRGFAILLMVLANYAAGINWIPVWLKHAPDIGLTATDLIAPFFIFAIGLTYRLSAQKRFQRDGLWWTLHHFLRRCLALIGLGCLFSAGEGWLSIDASEINWGVLQAIGVAELFTLPVLTLSTHWRWGIGITLLTGYQVMLNQDWQRIVLRSPHGGLLGSLGWTAMLILATALADAYHSPSQQRKLYPLAAVFILLVGVWLAGLVPVSKHRISASYVLISLGASSILFAGFHWLGDRWRFRVQLLSAWGKNPLLLYLLHELLLAVFVLPPLPNWYVNASLELVFCQALTLISTLSWIGWRLHRKGWAYSL